MFETIAPFIIAGLLIAAGYMWNRWLTTLGELKQLRKAANTAWLESLDELEEAIARADNNYRLYETLRRELGAAIKVAETAIEKGQAPHSLSNVQED